MNITWLGGTSNLKTCLKWTLIVVAVTFVVLFFSVLSVSCDKWYDIKSDGQNDGKNCPGGGFLDWNKADQIVMGR